MAFNDKRQAIIWGFGYTRGQVNVQYRAGTGNSVVLSNQKNGREFPLTSADMDAICNVWQAMRNGQRISELQEPFTVKREWNWDAPA